MAVLAVQQIRQMRGGAQGQLMLGADGNLYVVKFQNNPQHTRVLANELVATRLALALNAPSTSLNAQVVVRTVKVSYTASFPDLVDCEIAFANDWADDLAIKTSAAVPADTWLPAEIAPTVLANLSGLTVTALSGSSVTINTGTAPPTGGGFEIRVRDFCFMPGEDPTLVTRTSAQTITFSRVSAADRFYIRMYDGNTPPNYSEFSTALFINLPLST